MGFDQDFFNNVILLVLTAVLSGLLIPYILKRVDERKLRDQKEFEAELARQAQLIESQVQLLDNLTQVLWEYQLLAIAVSYYRFVSDPGLYTTALTDYDAKVAEILVRLRSEISKALRLAPSGVYERLSDLYYKELLPLDQRLRTLIENPADDAGARREWHEFNDYAVFKLSKRVDGVLDCLAQDLRLKGSNGSTASTIDDSATD